MNNKTFRKILGLIIIPILSVIYFIDRLICVPFFWLSTPTIKDWFEKTQYIINSFIRVFVIGFINAIIGLIL